MASGMIDVSSRYSVPETLARLQSILKEKGIMVLPSSTTAERRRRSASKCGRRSY